MLRLKKRKLNRAQRSVRDRAGSTADRIKLIRAQLIQGKLNPGKLPTLLKTRINGKINNAITLDHENVQSFIWSDTDGRKMLLSPKPDSIGLDERLIDIMEAMMEADKGRLEATLPEKLFIESSPEDDQAAIGEKLRLIDPALPERTVFIAGGQQKRVFRDLRADLELASRDRKSNPAYKQILHFLEQAISAENEPVSSESLKKQLGLIEQMEAALTNANSTHRTKKVSRNDALLSLADNLRQRKSELNNNLLTSELKTNLSNLRGLYSRKFKDKDLNTFNAADQLGKLAQRVEAIRKERKALISNQNPEQIRLAQLRQSLITHPGVEKIASEIDILETALLQQFNVQRTIFDLYDANRNFIVKAQRIVKLERENDQFKSAGTLTPFNNKLKNDIGIAADETPITTAQRRAIVKSFSETTRHTELVEVVSEQHVNALKSISKTNNYTLAIRETGALSVRRINQGAKPKPHTILEKSIKDSSIKAVYGDSSSAIIKQLTDLDLMGFVGHWKDNELAGLRVDGIGNSAELVERTGLQIKSIPGSETGSYIEFDLKSEADVAKIKELVKLKELPSLLYTGDYDLHEAYQHNRQIMEGSTHKTSMLKALNNAIAKTPGHEQRTAQVSLDATTQLIHVDGPYAMFQHGDQATYRMNQILEAGKKELEAAISTRDVSEEEIAARRSTLAELVVAVATESDESLAWFRQGRVYVTRNKDEHELLRQEFNLTKPNTWQDELVVRKNVEIVPEEKAFPDDPAKNRSNQFRQFRAQQRAKLAGDKNKGKVTIELVQ